MSDLSDYMSTIPEAEPLTKESMEEFLKRLEQQMFAPVKWVTVEELKAMYPEKVNNE